MEINRNALAEQVQGNCNLSDALYGGVYPLCSLLLRMRDLFKWERGLRPWQEPEPPVLLEWMETQEDKWGLVSESVFRPIEIGGERFQPFDAEAVNVLLRPHGLVYGAGYGTGMKPTFLLGELSGQMQVDGLEVDIVHRELARDLFTSPAMRQGNHVLARSCPMQSFLWDQILEMRPSAAGPLSFALACYGIDVRALRGNPASHGMELEHVAGRELEAWVYHEVGEAAEDVFDGHTWHGIVATYANTPVEIFARVIKDLLADTHEKGLLKHVIEHRMASTLGFYVSFMRSFTRLVFPEIRSAFFAFEHNKNWDLVDEARHAGYERGRRYGDIILEIDREASVRGTDWGLRQIKRQLIEPLGIVLDQHDDDMETT